VASTCSPRWCRSRKPGPRRRRGWRCGCRRSDREPGLGEAELGPIRGRCPGRRRHRVEADAELAQLRPGPPFCRAETRSATGWSHVLRRDVVVHRGQGQVGAADRAGRPARSPSNAWGDVTSWTRWEIDVEEGGLGLLVADDVGVPHLLRQGLCLIFLGHRGAPRYLASHILRRQYCYVDIIATNVGVLDKSVPSWPLGRTGPVVAGRAGEATGLARPTAHRLARPWSPRLVGRDGAGRYRLGLRLLGWAGAVSAELGLVEAARPELEALRDQNGGVGPAVRARRRQPACAWRRRSGPAGLRRHRARGGGALPSTGLGAARCCWAFADDGSGGPLPRGRCSRAGNDPPPGLGGQCGRTGGGGGQCQRPRPRLGGTDPRRRWCERAGQPAGPPAGETPGRTGDGRRPGARTACRPSPLTDEETASHCT